MSLFVFTKKYPEIQRKIITNAIIDTNGISMPVRIQWDTGATGTCISKEVVSKLQLIPIGMVNVHTPSGIGTMNQYTINLILNNEIIFHNWVVMDSEIGKQGIDVLIGMDIISNGDFAISNYEGRTQFSFRIPSQEHIEYKRTNSTYK
mgnify:CR=1 FL=1